MFNFNYQPSCSMTESLYTELRWSLINVMDIHNQLHESISLVDLCYLFQMSKKSKQTHFYKAHRQYNLVKWNIGI